MAKGEPNSDRKSYNFVMPVELSAMIDDVCFYDKMDRSELVCEAVVDFIAARGKRRKSIPYPPSPDRGK